MRADRIRVGDVVEVDIRGRVFAARVTGFTEQGRVAIEPLLSWYGYYSARLRQVKRRLDPPPGRPGGQKRRVGR
jgi:hypothetical protein